jgi:N-acetylmuramoyl-L-alanine amidase
VVVDVHGARLLTPLAEDGAPSESLVVSLRSGVRDGKDLRVVFDLREAVRPKSFLLKPSNGYGHRLVIDLFPSAGGNSGPPKAIKETPSQLSDLRDVVIAIDPGHGGEDPGATGPKGTREKMVTLAIARRLADLIAAERGMRPVLLRDGDSYVGLRKRTMSARADLLLAIHADAFRDARVHGSSVYVLSPKGASSEAARWLAEQENAADLAGGVSLDDKDDLLASVLLDLSQTATLNASLDVGAAVFGELRKLGKTHKQRVERAGFAVLKSPDIPSILVEAAFLSNPTEESKLNDPAYQSAITHAILAGIKGYFSKHPPPGTLFALRQHVIAKGDTLSDVATRYRVSVSSLRSANGLADDRVQVGQVLRIPYAQDG